MRCLDVTVEMRFLFVLVGTSITRVFSLASVVTFVQDEVTSSGELFIAARHVALDVLASVQSYDVCLQRRILSKAFPADFADKRFLLGMHTCNAVRIRILLFWDSLCSRR